MTLESEQQTQSYYGRVMQSDFVAPWWAKNRHLQTLFPRFLQKRQALTLRWEYFNLADGDRIRLAWAGEPQSAKGLLIMFHGLEGSVHSHYCNDTAAALVRQNYAVVVMHFRACGGELNQRTRAYHSGETSDPWEFMQFLQESYPDLPKFAIGFSLGGNMLLKLLGEHPQQTIIKAAVAVSAPLQLADCADTINKGFSRLYQRYLLKSMLTTLWHKMAIMDYQNILAIKQHELPGLKSFRDFDQHVTAPLHGFIDADDYYQRCSAMAYLSKIQTPTLILHARDDPFMHKNAVPRSEQLSDRVRVELSEQGGHVAFVQGSPWRPTIWLHQRVYHFLESFYPAQKHTSGALK